MKQLPILLVSSAALVALIATVSTPSERRQSGEAATSARVVPGEPAHAGAAAGPAAAEPRALRAAQRPAGQWMHVAAGLDKEQAFEVAIGHERRSLEVPRDFLNGIVGDGNRKVAFTAPGGVEVVGSVKHLERDAEGVLLVSGPVTSPHEGWFYFRRQTNPGVAGAIGGFVRFTDEELAYRMEPAAPGGEPALVERMIGEIMCVNYAPKAPGPDQDADSGKAEIPKTHPADFDRYDDLGMVIPLESLPGATGVIYLDFDGETGPFPEWGDLFPGVVPHSGASNVQIKDVWERVAEDFQPFNLNVTTDLSVYEAAPDGRRIQVIITPLIDFYDFGGVAMLGSFNEDGKRVCWALYTTGKNAAEVITHEIGHTLRLNHHGIVDPDFGPLEYYEGHGSGDVGWAPIMGVGYERNVTQWSNGEYEGATNPTQDDLLMITTQNNDVDYRDDDFGSTLEEASYLEIFPGGTISNEGIIERTGDMDSFRFRTTGGGTVLTVSPVKPGANLDIRASLFAANGTRIANENPISILYSTISLGNLPAGEYVLRVTGAGWGTPNTGYTNYGSLGAYTIAGIVTGGVMPQRFSVVENQPAGTVVGRVSPRELSGAALSYEIESGNDEGIFSIDASTGDILVADAALLDYELHTPRWDRPARFQLFVRVSNGDGQSESLRTVVSIEDVNEAPVIAEATIAILERIPIGSVVHQVIAEDPDSFDQVAKYEIVSGDPSGLFSISNTGAITAAGVLDADVQATYELQVRVTDSASPAAAGTGTITVNLVAVDDDIEPGRARRLLYQHGGAGEEVADLENSGVFPEYPFAAQYLTSFDAGSSGDAGVGSSIVGYVVPSVSGDYRFWITANFSASLRLSPDRDRSAAEVIDAIVGTGNPPLPNEWVTEGSETVTLEAGQPYYIEARHVQNGAENGHVSVAWEGPGIERQVVPGINLAPAHRNYAPRIPEQTLLVRRNTFPGGFVGNVTVSDFNEDDSHSGFTILGGSGDGLFNVNAATGEIRLADADALADDAPTSYDLEIEVTDDGDPNLSGSGTVTLTIVDALSPSLVQEIWTDVEGAGIDGLLADPRYPDSPSARRQLSVGFDSGGSAGVNYGSRIRGFITAPATGSYQFYLSGDDEVRLLLGTSDDPATAREILRIEEPTVRSRWQQPDQISAPIALTAGQRYYIETLQRQTDGDDFVQVSWSGPGTAVDNAYRYYRYQPTKTRNGGSRVHLAQLRFYRGGRGISMEDVTVTGVNGGDSPPLAGPQNLVDDTLLERWTDFSLGGVIFDFGEEIRLNGYQFGTAGTWNYYDPVSWTLEGSVDGESWVLLHTVNDHETTPIRWHYDQVFIYPALVPADALDVLDPNRAPIFDQESYAFSIFSDLETGAEVGAVSASDPEGDPVTYALTGGNDSGIFAVDPTSGAITVADATVLVAGTYSLQVGAQDNGSGVYELATSETTVEIEVTDPPAVDEEAAALAAASSWRAAKFGAAAADPAIASDLADPDGDGMVNLLEYAFGTDPNEASPPLEASYEGEFIGLVYQQDLTANVNFSVEISSDLQSWSAAEDAEEEILSDDGTIREIRVRVPRGVDGGKFLRIRVSR